MVAAITYEDIRWAFAPAPRPLPDRRVAPGGDYILFDGDGRPLGTVRAAVGEPALGAHAPEVFLRREIR